MDTINIAWLYPDVLDLHGGRGDLLGLRHGAELLGLDCRISRVDRLEDFPDLDWADILWLGPGEVRCSQVVAQRLGRERQALLDYAAAGRMLVAVASSGAVLARQTTRADGSSFAGLGLLDMDCHEPGPVYGNDLWFALPDGEEIMAVQISLLHTLIAADSPTQPLGRVLYGRGNSSDGKAEGAWRDNVIFTNALGPVCVKNPRFSARLLAQAAAAKGLKLEAALSPEQTEREDASFELIKRFIQKKQAGPAAG